MGYRGKLLVLCFCLANFQAEAKFRNPFSKPHDSTADARPTGEIPFEFGHSYMVVVKGSLNGVKGRNLLIDTGSNPMVLDAEMARKLGVQGQTGDLQTLYGSVSGAKGILSSATLGPVAAKSIPVFIADLSFISKDLGTRIDAVVGLDVLKVNNFLIDYESRRIVFGSRATYRDSIPFATDPPIVTVSVSIGGETKRLLVDTGAEGLFLFRDENRRAESSTTAMFQNTSHFSPVLNREQIEVSDVRLGKLHWAKHAAYLVRGEDSSHDFDGLLGLPALGVTQVVFDFDRGRLGWR